MRANLKPPASLDLEWLDLGRRNFNDPFDPAAPVN